MSTEQGGERKDTRVESFIGELAKLDTGARARLKRNAGLTIAESRDVLGLFFRLLPRGVGPWGQERYFLVATLYPLAEAGGRGNLGTTLRAARTTTNSAGIDRRMEVLLDSDVEQLRFRLRQTIRFAHTNRARVNWSQLLSDVLQWERPERHVQRSWAEAYFR